MNASWEQRLDLFLCAVLAFAAAVVAAGDVAVAACLGGLDAVGTPACDLPTGMSTLLLAKAIIWVEH